MVLRGGRSGRAPIRAVVCCASFRVRNSSLLSSPTDDLKLSIDTLGTALTSFTADYPSQMEKLSEDSRTVFNRVDDTWNRLNETQEGLKYEHSVTRVGVDSPSASTDTCGDRPAVTSSSESRVADLW